MASRPIAAIFATLLAVLLLVGAGCRCSRTPPPTSAPSGTPSVRLYLISTLAGAMEPCGCVKDMLGGVDHFAALVAAEAEQAPRAVVLGAGPTLFMDPAVKEQERVQSDWKARVIADVLAQTGFVGWAPGVNDFALGAATLGEIKGKGSLFAANLEGAPGFEAARVIEVGGERVGIAGVSVPKLGTEAPAGVEIGDAAAGLERARDLLGEKGARIKIALLAMPRGEALRLAERVPGFQLVLLGKPGDRGEGNDPKTPPVLVGDALVVETPNHLQSVAVVDFFVKDGAYRFADGSGIANEERRVTLAARVAELESRLAASSGDSADLAARRQDLVRMKKELADVSREPPAPKGSFFRYRLVDVKESLGSAPAAAKRLDEYYRRVNRHNQQAFADHRPAPVPPGESGYAGVDACTTCHQPARMFWDQSRHAGAYATLSEQNKEFNLECVSCHVTGYEAPGGSTVAHVGKLESVQCEVCHGPGSRHVESPTDKGLITLTPERSLCASKCHHPPHVKPSWSVDESWPKILGPGHGKPLD